MKKIIIAGAGHGGLTCGTALAKKGYDVTIAEARERDDMGHDWHDMMDLDTFDFADIPRPPANAFTSGQQMCFFNPKKDVKIVLPFDRENKNAVCIDRKMLTEHLLGCAEKSGVKFIFGCKITAPVISGTRVIGIEAEKDGEAIKLYGDLIIDAAGIDSPVRLGLPEKFGIYGSFGESETFYVYRAYFEKTANGFTDPRYTVYFFNEYRPGIDWVITEEEYLDILIGKFGKLTQEEIDTAVAGLRERYPYMGDKIIRGGVLTKIPIRRTIPLLVCDGYAAIGDSAGMTVPLNGSGINLSMKAGKILAQTVSGIKNGEYTKEALWQYQYRYCKSLGEHYITIDMARKFLSGITGENVDAILEKKIVTENEIAMAGGNNVHFSVTDVIRKSISAISQLPLVPGFVSAMKGISKISSVSDMMPSQYDEKKIAAWREKYEEL